MTVETIEQDFREKVCQKLRLNSEGVSRYMILKASIPLIAELTGCQGRFMFRPFPTMKKRGTP